MTWGLMVLAEQALGPQLHPWWKERTISAKLSHVSCPPTRALPPHSHTSDDDDDYDNDNDNNNQNKNKKNL